MLIFYFCIKITNTSHNINSALSLISKSRKCQDILGLPRTVIYDSAGLTPPLLQVKRPPAG